MKSLEQCRLYTFIDSAYLRGRDPADLARELCEGGSDLIQLRAKDWTLDQIQATAATLLPITASYGVGLVINDYLSIAAQTNAPVCHLGQEDFFDAGYSSTQDLPGKPPHLKVGLSTHAPAQAERALRAGADYIAIGPIFPTGTKPSARAVTLDYVRWAAENVRGTPWFAIGGINLGNLAEVQAAGATRICVVSAILNARSVRDECRRFRDALTTRTL